MPRRKIRCPNTLAEFNPRHVDESGLVPCPWCGKRHPADSPDAEEMTADEIAKAIEAL